MKSLTQIFLNYIKVSKGKMVEFMKSIDNTHLLVHAEIISDNIDYAIHTQKEEYRHCFKYFDNISSHEISFILIEYSIYASKSYGQYGQL